MVNPNEAIVIDELAETIYEKCSEDASKLYKQHELAQYDIRLGNPQMLVSVINYMLKTKLFKPKQQGNDFCFQIVDRDLAEK